MRSTLLVICLWFLIASCGNSCNSRTNFAQSVHVNKYKLSAGADSIFTSYNRLFSGMLCHDSIQNVDVVLMTMPISCYTTIKPNIDSPISFGADFNKDICHSFWEFNLDGIGNCKTEPVHWPIDTSVYHASNSQVDVWFIERSAYQKYADTCKPDSSRFVLAVIRHVPVISATNIKKLVSWSLESDNGYWAKKLPGTGNIDDLGYKNLYNSTGVIVKLMTKNDTGKTIDCYIIASAEGRTIRWKDTSASK